MKIKKVLALLLITVLSAALLSGCSPDDTGTYKVGVIAPMSGSTAYYGQSFQKGAQMAQEEIAQLGGVKFELNYADIGSDPSKFAAAYESLLGWNMQVFAGPLTSVSGSAFSEAVSPDVFTLIPTAGASVLLGGTTDPITGAEVARIPSVFQLSASASTQGMYAAQQLTQSSASKIAVFWQEDDPASAEACASFRATVTGNGKNVVASPSFPSDKADDFSAQIAALRDSGADAVFLPIHYDTAARFLTQCAEADYAPAFFGGTGVDGILTVDGFDPAFAEGMTVLTTFNPDQDSASQTFAEAYRTKYNEEPNQYAAAGYDSVYLLYGSLALAGCTSEMPAAEIIEPLTTTFVEDLVFTGFTGMDINWEENGLSGKVPLSATVSNGTYTIKE